jgi:hypothetical protein
MSDQVNTFNDALRTYLDNNYNGFDAEVTVPGALLAPFVNTRLDISLTIENCIGDKQTMRRFTYVFDEDLIGYDRAGLEEIFPGGTC